MIMINTTIRITATVAIATATTSTAVTTTATATIATLVPSLPLLLPSLLLLLHLLPLLCCRLCYFTNISATPITMTAATTSIITTSAYNYYYCLNSTANLNLFAQHTRLL